MIPPFDAGERRRLLERYDRERSTYNAAMDFAGEQVAWSVAENRALDQAEECYKRLDEARTGYFERLPFLTMSVCPFDGRTLVRSFDPFGFDGLWWRPDASPEEAPTCPHFCVLLGAVRGTPQLPRARFQVRSGPERPYVIPRLLDHPAMVAVIGQIAMDGGATGYPVAYFAAQRPPRKSLTAAWARSNFVYTTQLEEDGWRVPDESFDFDLYPWLRKGKVRWCAPGSDNSVLSAEPAERCPFVSGPMTL